MLPSLISVSLTPGASECWGVQALEPPPAAVAAAPPWSPPPAVGAPPPPVAAEAAPVEPALERAPVAEVAPAPPAPAPRASTYCWLLRRAPHATDASSPI